MEGSKTYFFPSHDQAFHFRLERHRSRQRKRFSTCDILVYSFDTPENESYTPRSMVTFAQRGRSAQYPCWHNALQWHIIRRNVFKMNDTLQLYSAPYVWAASAQFNEVTYLSKFTFILYRKMYLVILQLKQNLQPCPSAKSANWSPIAKETSLQ